MEQVLEALFTFMAALFLFGACVSAYWSVMTNANGINEGTYRVIDLQVKLTQMFALLFIGCILAIMAL